MLNDPLLLPVNKTKPFLFKYDSYQTYDAVVWQYLPRFVELALLETFNDSVPYFPKTRLETFNAFFVERFTPFDYPWAQDYSIKLAELLAPYCFPAYNLVLRKPFNETDYADLQNGYESEFALPVMAAPKQDYFAVEIEVNLPSAEPIFFTWLAGDDLDERPLSAVKRNFAYYPHTGGKQEIQLILDKRFLVCSMVVSGSNSSAVESALDKLGKGLLFKNFDALSAEFHSKVKLQTDHLKVCTHYKQQLIKLPSAKNQSEYTNFTPEFYQNVVGATVSDLELTIEREFSFLPDWYRWAGVAFANNNYWNNTISIDISQDWGKPVLWAFRFDRSESPYAFTVDRANKTQVKPVEFFLWPFIMGRQLNGADYYFNDLIKTPAVQMPYGNNQAVSETNLSGLSGSTSAQPSGQIWNSFINLISIFYGELTVELLNAEAQEWLIENEEAPPLDIICKLIENEKLNQLAES